MCGIPSLIFTHGGLRGISDDIFLKSHSAPSLSGQGLNSKVHYCNNYDAKNLEFVTCSGICLNICLNRGTIVLMFLYSIAF